MALQDLTPQLRTRLGRMERAVGLFVGLAAVLLIAGFCYYLYATAQRKGWLLNKVAYNTVVMDATGLKVGDPVRLMGFDVGEITEVTGLDPSDYFNVYVQFVIRSPFYGYLWQDSKVKVGSADLLGKRYLEVVKGKQGPATVLETNRVVFGRARKRVIGILDDKAASTNVVYLAPQSKPKGYFLEPEEAPAMSDRVNALVQQVEKSLPGILALTNNVTRLLTQSTAAATNLDALLTRTQPLMSNLVVISTQLREPRGALGEWLLPTNIHHQLDLALTNANNLLESTDAHLAALVEKLAASLDDLSGITSNLHAQVDANTNVLAEISDLIRHSDELVQGLKRHWLLRSSFRAKKTPAPTSSPARQQP
jgi:ABC-type transporter Mla subunit MlaD